MQHRTLNAQHRTSNECIEPRGSKILKEPTGFGLSAIGAVADGKDFEAGAGDSLIVEAELFGGAWGDVEMATRDEGAAIIETNFDGFSVFEIRHFDQSGQGEGFVGTGEVPGIDFFAQRGVPANEAEKFRFIIPRAPTGFGVSEGLIDAERMVSLPANGVGPCLVTFVAAGAGNAGGEERKSSSEEKKPND
jgi:hypothetical protein